MKDDCSLYVPYPVPPRDLDHDDDLDGAGAVLADLGETWLGFSGPWQTARGNKTAFGQHISSLGSLF